MARCLIHAVSFCLPASKIFFSIFPKETNKKTLHPQTWIQRLSIRVIKVISEPQIGRARAPLDLSSFILEDGRWRQPPHTSSLPHEGHCQTWGKAPLLPSVGSSEALSSPWRLAGTLHLEFPRKGNCQVRAKAPYFPLQASQRKLLVRCASCHLAHAVGRCRGVFWSPLWLAP